MFRLKSVAQAWAAKIEADLDSIRAGKVVDHTFAELLDEHIKRYACHLDGYHSDILRLRRTQQMAIGKVKLSELSAKHVADWRDERLKSVTPDSVAREWGGLSKACTSAIKEYGWMKLNPFSMAKKPIGAPARSRRISQEEIDRILYVTAYSRDYTPQTKTQLVAAVFLFAIETAMRAGEILALQWDRDVDLARRVARVLVCRMNMQPILLELQAPEPDRDKDYGTTIQHETVYNNQWLTVDVSKKVEDSGGRPLNPGYGWIRKSDPRRVV